MGLVQVVIDSREPPWVQSLQFGVPTEVAPLEAGDLLGMLDDGQFLAIERKSCSDLLNTLREERLFDQVRRLRETTPWAYLVVTGTLQAGPGAQTLCDGRVTGWAWPAIQGALLDVQELGVGVLHVAGEFDYLAAVGRLAGRKRDDVRTTAARSAVPLSDAERILAAFPGIGVDRAQAVLGVCGSPAYALQWLTSLGERIAVPGVGDETRRRARRALGLEEHSALMVTSSLAIAEANEQKKDAA